MVILNMHDVVALLKERGSCELDFSFMCPLSWLDAGNGQWCLAPASYVGSCKFFSCAT